METPFDELYDVKQESTRKEKTSSVMASMHTIPKKIADVAQTQGVSEKFLEHGMPSGVINPSLLAHDRYLSAVDAIQDAILIGILLLIIPFFSLNWFTGTLYFIVLSYWFFHISWWEKTKVWALKGSSKRYIKNTYSVYWTLFFIIITPIAIALWYFIFQLGAQVIAFSYVDMVLSILSGMEKAIADVFGATEFVKNNFSANANYKVTIDAMEYERLFIVAAGIFFSITIVSKIFFGRMYKSEQDDNKELSQNEMLYSGEQALEAIKKARK